MLNRWRIDPITRRRLRRFRRIRRGYLSFLVLLTLTGLSLVSNYIANRRAIVVSYQGELYFPTFRFYDMATFGQQDEYGFVLAKEGDAEGMFSCGVASGPLDVSMSVQSATAAALKAIQAVR